MRRSAPARRRRPVPVAAHRPVARVAVDVPLAHLDRPFDYLVPERLSDVALPGCRVRVRFAGQLTGGFLLARLDASDHPGRLAPLERVVSPEPVLSPEIAALAREVADRYAGTLADVLRLAIPPRHAAAESAAPRPGRAASPAVPGPAVADLASPAEVAVATPAGSGSAEAEAAAGTVRPGAGTGPGTGAVQAAAGPWRAAPPRPDPGPWARYPAGEAFLAALARGQAPRAVWTALPGPHWADEIARAAAAAASAGRGALIVVPDARDLDRVDAALASVLGPGRHVILAAGLGPAERYRRWLAVSRGAVRVVAGTRAAMFAPVRNLGLVVIWDDGDDLHAEPRAPYPHAREVLALRAHRARAAALIGGFARTAEATSLLASGWAVAVAADRPQVRQLAPRIRAAGTDAELARDEAARSARLPSVALRTARDGLAAGPVLVQVPRRGYLTAVACARCRAPARCGACGGPLAVEARRAAARCRWCGAAEGGWRCPDCGGSQVRAVVTGAGRTAEELGRAFPGTPVLTSGGDTVLAAVPSRPALVVATPGAEPAAMGGYAAALLLDGWALLGRPSLRAAEEALRRWLNAAALVRPGAAGGTVTVVADGGLPAVQALIRWDPATHAERELAEREQLHFPPAVRMAAITGHAQGVAELLAAADLPAGAEVLGPVAQALPVAPGRQQAEEVVRMLVRAPRGVGAELAAALQAAQAARSARKDTSPARVQFDPVEFL